MLEKLCLVDRCVETVHKTGIAHGRFSRIYNIHVIFSWAQIGRSAIFGREIGVPDREIFSQQKKIKFNVKNCLFASA